jgi:Excalibur calcium-binding domain
MDAKQILFTAATFGIVAGSIWASVPPAASQSPEQRTKIEQSIQYAGCNEVRALGKSPLYAGQPGYREDMDGDGDGVACEPHPGVDWKRHSKAR